MVCLTLFICSTFLQATGEWQSWTCIYITATKSITTRLQQTENLPNNFVLPYYCLIQFVKTKRDKHLISRKKLRKKCKLLGNNSIMFIKWNLSMIN